MVAEKFKETLSVGYYSSPEPDLPHGIAPAVFASWDSAIRGGYFLRN